MHCPFCRHPDSRVIDSRTADDGASIRRRRECTACRRRFSTIESFTLTVMKRSGVTEPFSREKIITGIRKSCQGRPVTEDQIKALAQSVEEQIRMMGSSIVDAGDIGTAILRPLRELDTVAYLRFASVYSSFNSLDDFENAIAELRTDPAGAGGGEAPGTGGSTS
ncbi:MAG: transcriptional regulator NrdR [Ruaniaceae bacterium]|nr:transcriptional regulator NrdR [Ruaniaceae bacterium]